MSDDDAKMAGLRLLSRDLQVFCAHCLQLADKKGRTVAFHWNASQRELHAQLQAQRAQTGKVRALVLKGRQMGISTYVAARFYHATTMNFGRRTLIVAHQQKSTNNLFDMVKRYHRNNPMPVSTANSNAIELVFDKLDGKYALATAGTEDVARGMTAQLAHLSEFAFWTNGQKHMAGLGNTVPDVEGSEIIIESTANGLGNAFHQMWSDAEAGKSEYAAIFLPWFLEAEYRTVPRADLQLSAEDLEYQRAYGLDLAQMQWRANKLATYGDGFRWLWSQEYPATAAEAFQTSTTNPLINPTSVMAAVSSQYKDSYAPLVIGCDPAGDGVNDADRTAIVFRRGRMVFRVEYHQGLNTMQIAGKLAEYWREHEPDGLFVDKGGLGAGVYDRLIELNLPVIGVNSATAASDSERFENKRAEMWWTMKAWFDDQPCRLPNDAALISDLTAPQPKVSSNGRKLLEKKEDMKRRQVRSPDGADALALTFAEPVAHRGQMYQRGRTHREAPTTAGY